MTIELVTTSGVFALDGGAWEVENNIWIVGDDREVMIFDAAHDHQPIVDAVNGRNVTAIVLTHGHPDHIGGAPSIIERHGALRVSKVPWSRFDDPWDVEIAPVVDGDVMHFRFNN